MTATRRIIFLELQYKVYIHAMTPDKRLDQIEPVMADVLQKVDRLVEGQGQLVEFAVNTKAELDDVKATLNEQVLPLLNDHVVPTLDTLTQQMNRHVVPTLDGLAQQVSEHVIPTLDEHVVPTLDTLTQQMNGHVIPTLDTLTGQMNGHVIPTLDTLTQQMNGHVIPTLDTLTQQMNGHVIPTLDQVKTAGEITATGLAKLTVTVNNLQDEMRERFDRSEQTQQEILTILRDRMR